MHALGKLKVDNDVKQAEHMCYQKILRKSYITLVYGFRWITWGHTRNIAPKVDLQIMKQVL